jgi:mono/diheme cytochrome c family protein
MRPSVRSTLLPCWVLAAALAAPPGLAADVERGRKLYEQRCNGCHSESVHSRVKRVARDFGEVRMWVARWNETLALSWGAEEIEDVATFLNATLYHFPAPATQAKSPGSITFAASPGPSRQ